MFYLCILHYFKETIQQHKDYSADIQRLISKIFEINIDNVVNELPRLSHELMLFCQLLRSFAVKLYIDGNKSIAEKSFLILSRYDSDKGWAINLAFMKRRNETTITSFSLLELLDMCEKSTDAIWCLNKSLAYVSGSDNHEISWEKAVETVTKITENIENALEWWSDIVIVGNSEHNMVIIFLLITKKINLNDSKSIDERINQARADGYFIPEDI